jgi:rhodanese-related sulfurtransferase
MKPRILMMVIFMLLATALFAAAASDVQRISTEELNSRLGQADLAVVDVRTDGDWNNSDKMIASAIRSNPNDISPLRSQLAKDQTIVLYCA